MRACDVGKRFAGKMDDPVIDHDEQLRWDEACRREDAIRDLLSRHPEALKGRDVADLAWELGLSRATVYRMINLFRAGGTATLMTELGRPEISHARQAREEIINQTIASFTKPTRPFLAIVGATNCIMVGFRRQIGEWSRRVSTTSICRRGAAAR
jgi:putative transposase